MPVPVMTPEIRAKADAARKDRTAALAEITNGTLPVTTVLDGDEPRLLKTHVRRVLLAVHGVGETRADQMMKAAGVADRRRVKGLGANQRAKLTAMLRGLAAA